MSVPSGISHVSASWRSRPGIVQRSGCCPGSTAGQSVGACVFVSREVADGYSRQCDKQVPGLLMEFLKVPIADAVLTNNLAVEQLRIGEDVGGRRAEFSQLPQCAQQRFVLGLVVGLDTKWVADFGHLSVGTNQPNADSCGTWVVQRRAVDVHHEIRDPVRTTASGDGHRVVATALGPVSDRTPRRGRADPGSRPRAIAAGESD